MLLLFSASFITILFTFFLKKSIWVSVRNTVDISLRQSFFCWFTNNDIGSSTQSSMRWVFILNNIANVVIALCFLVMLVCVSLTGLSLMN